MKRALALAHRVMVQMRSDLRLMILSVIAPLIVIYLMKIFMNTMPPGFPVDRYVMPLTAFIVHFIAFLQSTIVLVQERASGTLIRMMMSGLSRMELIVGYVLGYSVLVMAVSALTLLESAWLFEVHYTMGTLIALFGILWLLSLVSVLLGMFVSTFAQQEVHVFPMIPLIALPSLFLSGLLVAYDQLPAWAQWLGAGFPLYYANKSILALISATPVYETAGLYAFYLALYGLIVLALTTYTLRETEL